MRRFLLAGVRVSILWRRGSSWIASVAGHDVYEAVGHGGQTIRVVPALDLVVVTTGDSSAPSEGIELSPLLADYIIPSIED
jgi:CubicO group peptidase (beta-lactamase class C family)